MSSSPPVVYDSSWERPAPSLLRPDDGIILYVSRDDSKCPSATECAAYRNRGVIVRFVFEDAAGRAASGTYADGYADGQLALDQVATKGGHAGDAVYFAADSAAALSLAYGRGFVAGLTDHFEPGTYGGDRNLERARTQLGIRQLWQASAKSWSDHWHDPTDDDPRSYGAYPYASLYQVVGHSSVPGTDLNLINHPAWAGGMEADDMQADERKWLKDLHDWYGPVDDDHPNVGKGQRNAGATIASTSNKVGELYNQGNAIKGIATLTLAAVRQLDPSDVDAAAVVDAIAEMGADVAKQVLDGLAARMQA